MRRFRSASQSAYRYLKHSGAGLPTVTAAVSGKKESHPITEVTIHMQDGAHTVAEITVHYPIATSTYHNILKAKKTPLLSNKSMWPSRAPVHLEYGRTYGDVGDFFGYVVAKRLLPAEGPVRGVINVPVSYTLSGISYAMQSQVSTVWKHVTASSIASSIAKKYYLRANITPHPRIWDYRAQDALSDFRFLAELATEIGYRFWIDPAGILYFVNPYLVFTNGIQSQFIPTYLKNGRAGFHDTLQHFLTDDGELTPSGGIVATRKVASINPSTGAEILAKDEVLQYTAFGTDPVLPLITQYRKDLTAESYNDALSLAEADAIANRHWVTAEATADGSPGFIPGSLIDIGGLQIPTEESGLWMIKSATHNFRLNPMKVVNSLYTCDLSLGRDQKYTVAWNAPANWTKTLTTPQMINVNGEWRAYFVGPSS